MPEKIDGYLDLGECPLISLEGLPQFINKRLLLESIPATSIPPGLTIGDCVVINRNQTLLEQDALSKGYKVKVKA